MRFTSPLITSARGTIGGATAVKGHGNQFIRAKVAPVTRRTTPQSLQRARLAAATAAWKALPQSTRSLWEHYAMTVTLSNTLGLPYRASGSQLFTRQWLAYAVCSVAPILKPPTALTPLPSLAKSTVVFLVASGVCHGLFIANTISLNNALYRQIISCTPNLSPGISSVSPRAYRFIYPGFVVASPGGNFNMPYNAVFPRSFAGKVVGVKLQLFNVVTAQLAEPLTFKTVTVNG